MTSFSWRYRISLTIFLLYVLLFFLTSLGWLSVDGMEPHYEKSFQPPSLSAIWGTDFFGRSVFARTLLATRTALLIGFVSTLIATLIATTLGALAGYRGGWFDAFTVWLYTSLDSVPYILLLGAFSFSLGQGLRNIFWALGLTLWTTLCKLVRNEVIKIKKMEFILAAQAQGQSPFSILFKEILPNVFHLILIQGGIIFVSVIKIEVILSYLGLGLEPGSPSWGLMIDDAKNEIVQGIWWTMAAPSLLMFGLIFSVQLLTEEWRQRFTTKSS